MKKTCRYCGKRIWSNDTVEHRYHEILCREGKTGKGGAK
jgi:hypothetical protein